MSFDKYAVIPFLDGGRDFDGCDCWGLVRLIYKNELGIVLPTYGEISALDVARVAREMDFGKSLWREVERPKRFDLALLRNLARGGLYSHIGIYVDDKRIMHTTAAMGVTVHKEKDLEGMIGGVYEYAK